MNAMNRMILTNAILEVRPGPPPGRLGGFSLPPRTLSHAVHAAVEEVGDEALHPLAGDGPQPTAQARTVLALMVRCYARKIYGSIGVAGEAASDPDFPWFWWHGRPDASALRRFRTENREAIQYCLAAALQFQVEEKISAGEVTRVSRPQIAEEANRRIIMAAFTDSKELDAE